MIVSGILWRNAPKNVEYIDKLKRISQKYSNVNEDIINDRYLTIIAGKVSKNDFDNLRTENGNILVGRIFNKASYEPIVNHQLANLNAEILANEWWGKYLFFSHSENESAFVLRDPTGQLPFFYHELRDGNIIFSSELCVLDDFLPIQPAYNWPYILSHILYNNNSNSDQTVFEGISELPPGCLLEFDTKVHVKIGWNPLNYSNSKAFTSDDFIAVLNASLKAWHHSYDNLLLSFSGGLDSTALLHCLKDTKAENQTLRAINFFHPKVRSSNELIYAQKICKDLDIELIELDIERALPFTPSRGTLPIKPNRPFPALTHMALMEDVSEIIDEYPSSLFINGQGGDHIFLSNPPCSLILDHFLDKGFHGIKSQLDALTHYYRTTILQVLKANFTEMLNVLFYNRSIVYKKHRADWVTKEFYKVGQKQYMHPIYNTFPKTLRLGKASHLIEVDHGLASIALELGDHNPVYSPLLYQPLLELALSVPTYEMLKNGYDRYPIRESISRTFNTDSVWRRSKGETTGIVQLGVKRNLEYVKMLCLEGRISKQGLIKKEKLEKEILSLSKGSTSSLWLLMNLISTEIFFEQWG